MTLAMEARLAAPGPWPRAMGTMPAISISVVIRIGRRRGRVGSMMAPRRGRVFLLLGGARPLAESDGDHAGNQHQRRHQNRTEAGAVGFDDGPEADALFFALVRDPALPAGGFFDDFAIATLAVGAITLRNFVDVFGSAGAQDVGVIDLQDAVFLDDAKEQEDAQDRINRHRLAEENQREQREWNGDGDGQKNSDGV